MDSSIIKPPSKLITFAHKGSKAKVRNKKLECLDEIQKRQIIDLKIAEIDDELEQLSQQTPLSTISQRIVVDIREKFYHLDHFIHEGFNIVKFASSKPADKTPLNSRCAA